MPTPFLNYYAGSMAPPVRGPNGTLVPVPNYLTPEQIYADILPPPDLPLNPPMPPRPSNSWPGGSDSTGPGPGTYAQMQGFANDPIYGGGDIQTAAALPPLPGPNGYTDFSKNPARLPSGTGLAFAGDDAPAAIGAIDSATTRPPVRRFSDLDADNWWVRAWLNQGSTMPLPSAPSGARKAQAGPGMVTGARTAPMAPATPAQPSGGLLGMLLGMMGGNGQQEPSGGGLGALLSGGMGGHDTSSPEAFAASVSRPSNMPGVEQFTGRVEQGQGGQNRYGSTARNELLALYGS